LGGGGWVGGGGSMSFILKKSKFLFTVNEL
jgi:hypothetical protein